MRGFGGARRTPSGANLVAPPRHSARLLFVYDLAVVLLASVAALVVRFDSIEFAVAIAPYLPAALIPVLVRPVTFLAFRLYRREWLYASMRELRDLVVAVGVGSAGILLVFVAFTFAGGLGTDPFPRSVFALETMLSLLGVASGRVLIRIELEHRSWTVRASGGDLELPTLVYGAGEAGAFVGRMASTGTLPNIRVVGYLDDDARKRGSRLMGHRVFGDLDDLEAAVEHTGATQLLVAIPSRPGRPVRRAVAAGQTLGLVVKTVPPLRDLLTGRYRIEGIRPVSVEDLLRRAPVAIDTAAIAGGINGSSVLVTGGGGSIGGELVRQILTLGPRVLTIVDHHEWTLWNIERDIAAQRRESNGSHVVVSLADVRSASAIDDVMRRAKPDVVFHAAALKHVPYVELFPSEGVLTNVIGTRNVMRTCERLGVPRLVLISTDKAVEPVSVMGATKRLAELLTVAAGHRSGCAYAAVRFGNVLGSSGSVVPLLQRQLDDGLSLTITQPAATRYFMTISEAVNLILEAGVSSDPGEIYVLDMGEPIQIIDLARDLVRLNGVDPETVDFAITGLRPGERLHEKLFYDDELAGPTAHPGILRAIHPHSERLQAELDGLVDELEAAAREFDDHGVRQILRQSDYITGMDRGGRAANLSPTVTGSVAPASRARATDEAI